MEETNDRPETVESKPSLWCCCCRLHLLIEPGSHWTVWETSPSEVAFL